MKKILLASANPYSFCIAVEHHLAKSLGRNAQVDGFNMFRTVSRHSPYYRGLSGAVMLLNRKYERFVRPYLSGEDVTERINPSGDCIPPLPVSESELRRYVASGAKVGLAALSTTVSMTTLRKVETLSEYGPVLADAWRSAHVSQRAGAIVSAMGYDEIYIFNGRHCYSRPFIDVVESGTRVIRYEAGSTIDSYIESDESIHDASSFSRMVSEHKFSSDAGEHYYSERLGRVPGNEATLLRANQVQGHIPGDLKAGHFVAYFSSSDDEMFSVRDDHNFGEFQSQMDIVRALAKVCRRQRKQLVLRFHPHLRFKHESWRREWDFDFLKEYDVRLIEPDDACDTYALAGDSHCVITRGSTVGFECSYLGIPNAVVGDCPGGRLGASVQTDDEIGLDAFVADPLLLPDAKDRALAYGSFYKVGGRPLPEFDLRSHLSSARIDGRIADPVRFLLQPLRRLMN